MDDWPENDKYADWLRADENGRRMIEEGMVELVRKHAAAVVWIRLGEINPDLVQEIVMAVIKNIGTFQGESVFSTWVHKVALNKCVDEIRRKTRDRDHIDPCGLDDEAEKYPLPPAQSHDPVAGADLDRLFEGLPETDRELLELKMAGHTDRQVAEMWHAKQDAVESSWRRLRDRLRQKNLPLT